MSLILNNLSVSFDSVCVVDDVSFTLAQGEILGIIGESGSGKSMIAKSIMGLVPNPGKVTASQCRLFGTEYYPNNEHKLGEVRGSKIAMITQDPKFALNPIMKVGMQIAESFTVHHKCKRKEAQKKAREMLEVVKIIDAGTVFHLYPHQLSGGMAQRVVIAMMLACNPKILIADEATSSLDSDTRKSILTLIKDLSKENNMSVIMISHDLNQVVNFCDNVLVMKDGAVVEHCTAANILQSQNEYTKFLCECMPTKEKRHTRLPEMQVVYD